MTKGMPWLEDIKSSDRGWSSNRRNGIAEIAPLSAFPSPPSPRYKYLPHEIIPAAKAVKALY